MVHHCLGDLVNLRDEIGVMTLGVGDAAALLRLSPDALMRKARAGKVPGAKLGRQWVFVRDDLVQLICEQVKARMPLYRQPKSHYWWVRLSLGGVKARRSTGTAEGVVMLTVQWAPALLLDAARDASDESASDPEYS